MATDSKEDSMDSLLARLRPIIQFYISHMGVNVGLYMMARAVIFSEKISGKFLYQKIVVNRFRYVSFHWDIIGGKINHSCG